jgi:Tfp pilus assembly protein PilN
VSQRLILDYAPTHDFSPKRITFLGMFLFVISLFSVFYTQQEYRILQADLQHLEEQKLAQIPDKSEQPKPILEEVISKDQSLEINNAFSLLNTPWDALFEQIEQIKLHDVAILNLLPNVQQQQIVIKGESKHLQAVLDYIELLEALPMLSHVSLQQHHVDETSQYKPVSFTILGHWQ